MKKITLLFLILPFLGLGQVQIGDDIDGEAIDDESGTSVSLSSNGNIVAIGAFGNDENGSLSGHVRVYENVNGIWTQIGQDIDGEAAGDFSGLSISLSSDGTIVAIGAQGNDGNGNNSGHVRVYENVNGTWTQIGQDIDGEAANDWSGNNISLSSNGSIVAIGAQLNDDNNNSGHARVYKNVNGTWTQIGQDIEGEANGDFSGYDINLSSDGSIVAIGARGNDDNGNASGHVRVYQNQSDNWIQLGQDIDGESELDEFGGSVSLSSNGTIVAIGARFNDENGTDSGHVRVYENQVGTWIQIGQDIDGESELDEFGRSVSLSSDGTIVAIGGWKNDGNGSNSGHVRLFKNQSNNWIQIGSDIDGEAAGDVFGYEVSLSSDATEVAISAVSNDGNGEDSGHVRVFSIASELAVLEVIEDIAGNTNNINVTASQLNSISGVSGAIEGVNYTTALDNGTFVDENNPTAAEIQFIIDQVNATLSVNELGLSNFTLYPNPAKTQFTIQLDPSVQLEQVSIYNLLGQVVLTSEKSIINTSKLASGSYIVEITTNKGKVSKKLIIE